MCVYVGMYIWMCICGKMCMCTHTYIYTHICINELSILVSACFSTAKVTVYPNPLGSYTWITGCPLATSCIRLLINKSNRASKLSVIVFDLN